MDPNAALARLRELADTHEKWEEEGYPLDLAEVITLSEEVIETFRSLDGWLCAGGFLPHTWRTIARKRGE